MTMSTFGWILHIYYRSTYFVFHQQCHIKPSVHCKFLLQLSIGYLLNCILVHHLSPRCTTWLIFPTSFVCLVHCVIIHACASKQSMALSRTKNGEMSRHLKNQGQFIINGGCAYKEKSDCFIYAGDEVKRELSVCTKDLERLSAHRCRNSTGNGLRTPYQQHSPRW